MAFVSHILYAGTKETKLEVYPSRYSVRVEPVKLIDYYPRDIIRLNISFDGKLLFASNLGGNFRAFGVIGPDDCIS